MQLFNKDNIRKSIIFICKHGIKTFFIKVAEQKIFREKEIDPDVEKANMEAGPGKRITEVMDLLLQEPLKLPVWNEPPIDIIIPVYNNKILLDPLFESIVNNTFISYRLLIANDKSTDLSVAAYLSKFKHNHPNIDITIVENEVNLGFVKTVNKMTTLTQNHFVLLNTDTEVPPHWLERLMLPIINNDAIASTTPFSNAGWICSFPKILEDNPIFENLDVASLDLFFQYVDLDKNLIEIPSGVGFCMGINKNVWDKVGGFDEAFGNGYGEENEWCMRASKSGYKHVIVPNLIVYHKMGGSFPAEEKSKLSKSNLKILREKHPDFSPSIISFLNNDPLKPLRDILALKILSSKHPFKLVFDQNLWEETDEKPELIGAMVEISVVLRFDTPSDKYKITFCGHVANNATYRLNDIEDIEKIIEYFNITSVILKKLGPFLKIYDLIDLLLNLKNTNNQIVFRYLVQDYFCICPIGYLLNYEIKYCGIPTDLNYCDQCIKKNPLIKDQISNLNEDLKIIEWHEHFFSLLDQCENITCFSQNSKDLIIRVYPNILEDKFEIPPHIVDGLRPVIINKTSSVINIAVLGNMSVYSGAHIIAALATYLDYQGMNIKIHIFGSINEPFDPFEPIKTIEMHKIYKTKDLPELMEENEIDLVFIPSIWPEPNPYPAEEVMKIALPLAVFEFGAPAEFIKNYNKGLRLEGQSPEYIIKTIGKYLNIDFLFCKKNDDITFVCVSNNELIYSRSILSSSYITEHRIIKYDNTEENVPIPIRYNQALDQLEDSKYSGWVFFVHNDFSLLGSMDGIVDNLAHDHLYGPIGAIVNGENKIMVGQILQGIEGRIIQYGNPVKKPTLVDTVDCQCLFFHTDLLSKYRLRFDENILLSFHQYVEEFCLNANWNFGIKTYAVALDCMHLSWGKIDDDFNLAIKYINSKYPRKQWAGTCTHLKNKKSPVVKLLNEEY